MNTQWGLANSNRSPKLGFTLIDLTAVAVMVGVLAMLVLPAPAQGVLCLTVREKDGDSWDALRSLEDPETRICAEAERNFLKVLQGGCRVPVGALAEIVGDKIVLSGVIASSDGKRTLRDSARGPLEEPLQLGERLARTLLAKGGREILKEYGKH